VFLFQSDLALFYLGGDVKTQYLRNLVGSGIGPTGSIPLAFTASIILTQELSKIVDSYDLILIRSFWSCSELIYLCNFIR